MCESVIRINSAAEQTPSAYTYKSKQKSICPITDQKDFISIPD